MKTLIIGQRGIGVTTFIKNKIIPTLSDNFVVFDMFNEYIDYKGNVLHITGLEPSVLEDRVVGTIALNDLIIMDFFKQYLQPKKDDYYGWGFRWLHEILENKTAILSFPSIKHIDACFTDGEDIEKIYLFDTNDTEKTKKDFENEYHKIITYIPNFRKTETLMLD